MWKKMVAPVILVSLLWFAGSTMTTIYIHRVYESHASALTENVSTIRSAWAMQDALWRLQVVVVETPGKTPRETQIEADELARVFQRHLADAETSSFTPKERDLVKAIREHFAVYLDHIQTRLKPASLSTLLVPQAAEKEKTMRLARAVADPCRQLLELNEHMLDAATDRASQLGGVINVARFLFLIAGPIVGVVCGLWIARSMHHSISEISVTLKGAAGESDRELGSVEVTAPGDFPALQHLAQMAADRIRRAMNELQEARQQALAAERLAAVGELAAGIAHELRNPLTSVKLLVQTAAQQQTHRSLVDQDLQVAQREIARMEDTIQGLLDFARPPQPHRITHDLRTTVHRALNLVEGRAKRQGVTVVEKCPPRPIMVDGDPEQVHQVLVNLLLNGIEAMPDGGTLRITLCAAEADDPHCSVVVADSGQGIPQHILLRIFEPFVTGKQQGTGLGLAISRRIAEEHGGTILAANRDEEGAVFTLVLPQCETEDAARISRDGETADA